MSTYNRPGFTYVHLNTLHPNVPAVKVWSESTLNGALGSGNYHHAQGNQAHVQAYPTPPTTPSNDPHILTNGQSQSQGQGQVQGYVHRQGNGQGYQAHANQHLHPAQLSAHGYAQASNQANHLSASSAIYQGQKTVSSSAYSPYSASSRR